MKELITRVQADNLIWIIGALGLIIGPLAAWLARKRGENPVKFGILCGGPLVLITIMWRVYNAIEDHFGLDSIAALAINFGLFLVVGAACGIGWMFVYGGHREASDAGEVAAE